MDSALLAVLGTLGGVAITAFSSIVGIWITTKNQRIAAERQLEVATFAKLRDERRAACVDYLTTYSSFREAVLAKHREHAATPSGATSPTLKPVEYARVAAADYQRAHHALQITFGDPIGQLEEAANVDLWNLGDGYSASAAEFDRMWAEARKSRTRLYEAIRDNLYGG